MRTPGGAGPSALPPKPLTPLAGLTPLAPLAGLTPLAARLPAGPAEPDAGPARARHGEALQQDEGSPVVASGKRPQESRSSKGRPGIPHHFREARGRLRRLGPHDPARRQVRRRRRDAEGRPGYHGDPDEWRPRPGRILPNLAVSGGRGRQGGHGGSSRRPPSRPPLDPHGCAPADAADAADALSRLSSAAGARASGQRPGDPLSRHLSSPTEESGRLSRPPTCAPVRRIRPHGRIRALDFPAYHAHIDSHEERRDIRRPLHAG